MLAKLTRGCSSNPPLVFLHGFLGSKEDWNAFFPSFEESYYCIAFDLPGHGQSPYCEDILTQMRVEIQKLKEIPIFIGYSMGGRIALILKDLAKKLIILSGHPGLKEEPEKIERKISDEKWSQSLRSLPFPVFLSQWYAQPVFHRQHKRCSQNPEDLARVLLQLSLSDQQYNDTFPCPTLFLYGEYDLKYRELYRNLPKAAKVCEIKDSSHAVHLDNATLCTKTILNWLRHMETTEDVKTFPWQECGTYTDIKFQKYRGIAKITINRPEVRNAFRPLTVSEMMHALENARNDQEIGAIILTGEGKAAFCSGGDQRIRGDAGYADGEGVHRLNVLDFQKQIRGCPKPVIAMVAGYAIGGGHVLHVVCDLTIAADNAIFGQTGPKVGSFDGGFGSSYLSRIVGQKKAREIWYLCRKYTAQEALDMGLVNCVVPYEKLEETTVSWCQEILQHSPLALRCLKSAFNADCDGQTGIQELAGNATLLYYMSEEAQEGHKAYLEKRRPDFTRFPKRP